MKKTNLFRIPAIAAGILLNFSVSYGNNFISNHSGFYQDDNTLLFQDTTSKKTKPTKKDDIDRTKGEAGRGQGKGTDTIPTTTGAGKRENRSEVNKATQDKTDQNSDNRGEGAGKNNRAGNSKKGVDTTKH